MKKFEEHAKDYKIQMKLDEDVPYVVTDLPYGRHSKTTNSVEAMYADFLRFLNLHLKFKAVVLFPHFVDRRSLIRASGILLEKEFEIPVHKGLTRYIVLLSRKQQ
ncbi:hypothetical protein HZB03_03325 [Candidatus Woesearchaeota archaeon]|nr:hypothetical protein [Candidatus Woesearchaeota archaeon]